jgi:hypothetical protein
VSTGQPDLDGVVMALRAAKVQVALIVFALRRGDRLAAEAHAINAQRQLAAAEIDADGQRGRANG